MAFLHSPFDLEQILVVDLAGSAEIFSFIVVLIVSFMMAKFNLSNKIAMVLFVLFTVIMSAYLSGLYVLVIILGGVVTFYSLSKFGR